jgi:hypothetical protein
MKFCNQCNPKRFTSMYPANVVHTYTPSITIEEIINIICEKELTPTVCEDSGLPEWTVGEARELATAIYNRMMEGPI